MICLLIQSKWKMDAIGKVKRYKDSMVLVLELCCVIYDGGNVYEPDIPKDD